MVTTILIGYENTSEAMMMIMLISEVAHVVTLLMPMMVIMD